MSNSPDPRNHRGATAATLLAVALVAGAVVAPALVAARPANQVPVTEMSGEKATLADPTADAWGDATATEVPLASAPSSVPDARDTSARSVTVEAVKTDAKLYVRMTWNDTSVDDATDGPRAFADAAAIQLPANTSTHPAIAMGSKRTPVNVWYWNANTGPEELLAGGPGSTTTYSEDAVQTKAVHEDGQWHLVYARDLAPQGDNRTQIRSQHDVDVAFAVWNGSQMERSGRKAVSEWYQFPLGPEPEGPPFQTILWTVAGVAIVAVLLVTTMAMRRPGNRE